MGTIGDFRSIHELLSHLSGGQFCILMEHRFWWKTMEVGGHRSMGGVTWSHYKDTIVTFQERV